MASIELFTMSTINLFGMNESIIPLAVWILFCDNSGVLWMYNWVAAIIDINQQINSV